jgi:hypothetical protein
MTVMRRTFAPAALILAVSCGGSPMAPSTNAPQQPASSLASGAYLLTVSMATSGNSGFSSCVSITIGGEMPAFAAVFVPTPVQVNHDGNTITITPDDPAATFRMQLQLAGASLSGTASGKFQSSATTVTVTGATSAAAVATGIVVGPSNVSGVINGTVSVQGLSCTNNAHTWLLAPR